MRHRTGLERAARIAQDSLTSSYVCRQCISQSRTRALHISAPRLSRTPFWKRALNRIIGNKEEEEAIAKREAAQQEKQDKLASGDLEAKTIERIQGVSYTVAPLIEARTNKEYTPTTDAKLLEVIGSAAWIKAQKDNGSKYRSFTPRKKVNLTETQWKVLLRHVALEALTLVKNGRSPEEICLPRLSSATGSHITHSTLVRIDGTKIELRFETPKEEKLLLDMFTRSPLRRKTKARQEQDSEKTRSSSATKRIGKSRSQLYNEEDDQNKVYLRALFRGAQVSTDWMNIPIAEPRLKLAIVKRITQLTGYRISDFNVSNAGHLVDLYNGLTNLQAPRRLVDTKQIQQFKLDLPNVSVFNGRVTPIHKEKQIGRWKIIEAELRQRGLPVTGSNHINVKINA